MKPDALFDQIVQAAPSFETVRIDHVSFHHELLSHVLIADLLRFLQSRFSGDLIENAQPPTPTETHNVFQILDRGLVEGDYATQNAIAVSFVEGIWGEPYFEQLKPFMGPNLSAELERQRNWKLP